MTQRKVFTEEFKRDAVKLARERGNLAATVRKHNPVSRPGSTFPIPRGGPAAINDLAHDVVGEILRNPKIIEIDRGAVFDIVAPDGRGMRFFANGAFKGFLEP